MQVIGLQQSRGWCLTNLAIEPSLRRGGGYLKIFGRFGLVRIVQFFEPGFTRMSNTSFLVCSKSKGQINASKYANKHGVSVTKCVDSYLEVCMSDVRSYQHECDHVSACNQPSLLTIQHTTFTAKMETVSEVFIITRSISTYRPLSFCS